MGESARPLKSVPTRGSIRPSRVHCSNLNDLARLEHYHLRLCRKCRLLVARRTAAPFISAAQIRECFGQIQLALAVIPRERYSLLVDARGGPSRNDPGFEMVLERERGKLLFGFGRNAALAATAAGRLQIQRFAKHDGREVLATDDPAEAFAYLELSPHLV